MKSLIGNVLSLVELRQDYIHDRLYDAFASTWNRIPQWDRKAIYRYLKKRPGRVYLCYRMDYLNPPLEPWGRVSWYECKTVMTFAAAFVEGAQPLEAVSSLIAHELAHCLRKATSAWTSEEDKEESATREVTASWNFLEPIPPRDESIELGMRGWQEDNRAVYGKYTETYVLTVLASST